MTTVDVIDRITQWVADNVCPKVQLKLPNDDKGDGSYTDTYELVNPAAFAMYIPTTDRLPEGVKSSVPSVCVRMVEGQDDLQAGTGRAEILLSFSAWNTGEHGFDTFHPDPDNPGSYKRKPKEEAAKVFARNGDGWRDTWNFLDTTRREVENAEALNGIRIIKEEGVKYGLYKEDDNLLGQYPLWLAWLSFSVEYGNTRIPSYYKDL